MLSFGKSDTAEWNGNRLLRSIRGEMSGHDSNRGPGLGKHRNDRLGEEPMQVRPIFSAQPLFGSKR